MNSRPVDATILGANRLDIIPADHTLAQEKTLLTHDANDTLVPASQERLEMKSQEQLEMTDDTTPQERLEMKTYATSHEKLGNPKKQSDIPTVIVKTAKSLGESRQDANSAVASTSSFVKKEKRIDVKKRFEYQSENLYRPPMTDIKPFSHKQPTFFMASLRLSVPPWGLMISPSTDGIKIEERGDEAGIAPSSVGCRVFRTKLEREGGRVEVRPPPPDVREGEEWEVGYRCKHCGLVFSTYKKLDIHARCIHSKYTCSRCRQAFQSYLSVLWHKNSHPTECTVCRTEFQTRSQLAAHRTSCCHSGLECSLCKALLPGRARLQAHYLTAHELYSCELCDVFHKQKIAHERHRARHRSAPHNDCLMCMQQVPDKCMKKHYLQKHARFKCDMCLERAATEEAMVAHVNTHINEYWCYVCRTWFDTAGELERHVGMQHLCWQCKECFLTPAEVRVHEEETHKEKRQEEGSHPAAIEEITLDNENPNPPPSRGVGGRKRAGSAPPAPGPPHPKKLDCRHCDASFITAPGLERHGQRKHQQASIVTLPGAVETEEELITPDAALPLACGVCHDSFATQAKLNAHEAVCHCNHLYECDFCGLLLGTMGAYVDHRDLHSRRYQCKFCPFLLKSLRDLVAHEKTHSVNYRCVTCQLRVGSVEELFMHKRIHMFKYQCRYCGVLCACLDTLTTHEYNLHTKYRCKTCGLLLYGPGELAAHERVHTYKYECKFCKRRVTTSVELKRHEEEHSARV